MITFFETYKYLVENDAGDDLTALMNDPSHISVVEIPKVVQGGNQYSSFSKTIFWNPYYGLKTTKGIMLSPATGLNHEADHALQDLKHPAQYKKDTDKKTGADKQYDKKEDRRVITKGEQETARKLKEIKKGQVTRTDHKGEHILVDGPRSTKPAAESEAERLLREKKQSSSKNN
jgi:hypothetical protein